MSRIGNNPISIPEGVSIEVNKDIITVKGKNGEMNQAFDGVSFDISTDVIVVKRNSESKDHKSKHGLYRSLVSNMVKGVSEGFTLELELVGVGYRATSSGQKAIATLSKKDVASFKLRKGTPIGAKVTLRGDRMYEFLDRLITIALPRVRDFQGVKSDGFDGRGNYNLGIQEQIIFPEINIDKVNKISGMDITFVTNTNSDKESKALLTNLGLPFKK